MVLHFVWEVGAIDGDWGLENMSAPVISICSRCEDQTLLVNSSCRLYLYLWNTACRGLEQSVTVFGLLCEI